MLDGKNHKVLFRKVYDTWGNNNDVKALVEESKKIPKGSVVIAVVKDEASRLLTEEAKKVFIKMGSEEIKNLGNREGWGFVGVYGQKVFGEQRGAKVRAAMTLSYSKAVKEKVKKPEKVEGGSRFEVHSAGYLVGNFAKIMVNNEEVSTCKVKDNKGCRGLNVVAADPFTHKVLMAKAYDTFASEGASTAFLADVKALPEGSIILTAVRDEASRKLSGKVRAFFTKLGS